MRAASGVCVCVCFFGCFRVVEKGGGKLGSWLDWWKEGPMVLVDCYFATPIEREGKTFLSTNLWPKCAWYVIQSGLKMISLAQFSRDFWVFSWQMLNGMFYKLPAFVLFLNCLYLLLLQMDVIWRYGRMTPGWWADLATAILRQWNGLQAWWYPGWCRFRSVE